MRKPKSGDESEEAIKKQVKLILKDTGWKFWMPNAGAFGRSGVSDFLAVKRAATPTAGLFMAIETKYEDVPTPLQLAFLKMIHEAGHYAFVVDETNVEILRTVLMFDFKKPDRDPRLTKWLKSLTPQPAN